MQLRTFLGLCNICRRFVPRYSQIAALLNALLKKREPVRLKEFGTAENEAPDTFKQTLTTAPVLALLKLGLPYVINTDSSEYQFGCALF